MESGFGQNLEGFLIKGNLSVIPSDLPLWQGDGSLEGAGTLYFDKIQEYNVGNGIDLAGIIIKNTNIYVPYVKPSDNATSASFVIDGGIGVNHTANATCVTSGGGLTVRGGASFGKNVHIGGILDVNSNRIVNVDTPIHGKDAVNKDYVDFLAGNVYNTNVSGNFTTGQVIIAETDGTKIRGYDSFTFDGSQLSINTPVLIKNSNASTGLSSGALVVYGGACIGGNSTLGGQLNLTGHNITNLATPVNPTDAATKQYVDENKLQGDFTTGQLIVASSVGHDVRGFAELTFDGVVLSLSSTENVTGSVGGAFVCYGGISISKDVFIGGKVNVNNNKVQNVAAPTNPLDAANKAYVDSRTFGTLLGSFGEKQVIIGTTDPNSLIGYSNFLFDGSQLSLGTNGSLVLYNTKSATSLTEASAMVVYGGGNVYGDLYVGGYINAGGNTIQNVHEPINPNDAATKQYVDQHGLNGNFTTGQLIIAASNGSLIRGYNNLYFVNDGTSGTLVLNNATDLSLENTRGASGLGSGGSLTINGGVSIAKNLYVGEGIDANLKIISNVATPIQNYDAVNKIYVDQALSNIAQNISSSYTTINLNNNVVIPEDIPSFSYPATTRAFVANAYLELNGIQSALYTLYGVLTENGWQLWSSFIGKPIGVHFSIRNNSGGCVIQYTNSNLTGITLVRLIPISQVNDSASANQINFTLSPVILSPQWVTGVQINPTQKLVSRVLIYVSSTQANLYGLFLLTTYYRDNAWNLNDIRLATTTGVNFSIDAHGQLQYTNSNAATDVTLRVYQTSVLTSSTEYTLLANTSVPTNINNSVFAFSNTVKQFDLMIYAYLAGSTKSAVYEIRGVFYSNLWKLNSRYVGDNLGIKFILTTAGSSGYLQYTNNTISNVYIKYTANIPTSFQPLAVSQGGTGKSYLNPYAVLRGNGSEPIVATDDFIYKDYTLTLGNQSSVLINNSTDATSLTSNNTFRTLGGAVFDQSVFIGKKLDMNMKNINHVADPIATYDAANKSYVDAAISKFSNTTGDPLYTNFTLNNNVASPQNITDFTFDSSVKAFISYIYVQYNFQECALFTIRGLKRGNGWYISPSYVGIKPMYSFLSTMAKCSIPIKMFRATQRLLIER